MTDDDAPAPPANRNCFFSLSSASLRREKEREGEKKNYTEGKKKNDGCFDWKVGTVQPVPTAVGSVFGLIFFYLVLPSFDRLCTAWTVSSLAFLG